MSTTTQPRTPAQIEASRVNGAKSKGAITPAGKTAISKNRMTHGFRSNSIVLSNEDPAAYDRRLDSYIKRYAPIDQTEEDLVGLLTSNVWQIMRINSIEVALFELEISGVDKDIEGQFEEMDQYGILALAFKKSAGDNYLELLRRYKNTAERAYHRALQALEQILKDRKSQQPVPAPKPEENLSHVQTREQSGEAPDPPPIDAPNPSDHKENNDINRTQESTSAPAGDSRPTPHLVLVSNTPRPTPSQRDITPEPPCAPKS